MNVVYNGGDITWAISGQRFSNARLVMYSDDGFFRQDFTGLESTGQAEINVVESGIPDGEYSYALVVEDPQVQQIEQDNALAASSNCIFSEDPFGGCLLYTSPSPRDQRGSRMPSSA